MSLLARKFWRAVACRVGVHRWEGKCANVTEQQGQTITLVWWECPHCGASRLKVILGNWKGTTP